MTQTQVQISDVKYNAGTQCFEALVTVNSGANDANYPCAIEAPITMTFKQATKGLKTQALRRHDAGKGFHSTMRTHVPAVRAGRGRFDPRAWLSQLGFAAIKKAA